MADDELHRRLQAEAITYDGEAHRALLAGDHAGASAAFSRAAETYWASWEAAPPRSYGRLVGRMKASILNGDGGRERTAADEILGTLGSDPDAASSPVAGWAAALAALSVGDDERAGGAAAAMRAGSDAFGRAADAVAALTAGDGEAYARAIDAIVEDFAGREEHLTGVPIADTAVVLERLAARRGIAARPESPLVPLD